MQATLTSCESSSMAQGAAKPAMSRQAFGSTRDAKVGAKPRGTRDRGPSLDRVCAACVAQGIGYVGGAVGALHVAAFRARRRSAKRGTVDASVVQVPPEPAV
jgi:hypothetical protein